MHVNQVKIMNILGVEKLEFSAGKFNVIQGTNGLGKTSALESIKACLKGGHDATLLRKGQEKGEAVLELSSGKSIRMRTNTQKTDRSILSESGKAAGTVSEIKALTDAMSVNPVEFLTASSDKRANIILESMPLRVDPEEIKRITGQQVQKDLDVHALDLIANIRKQIYDERTGINAAIRQAEAGRDRAIATMPEVAEGEELDATDLNAKKDYLQEQKEESISLIRNKLSKIIDRTNSEISAINEEIAALKEKISEKQVFISEQRTKANSAMETKSSEFALELAQVNSSLATLNERAANIEKKKIAEQQIEEATEEIISLTEDSEKNTEMIEELDEYKLDLLKDLPIPGLEVRDGVVFMDGVEFDRCNTAKQVQLAIKIAELKAGDLKIICADRMECLSSETFEIFKKEMLKSDCQVFVTRVTDDHELNVEVF